MPQITDIQPVKKNANRSAIFVDGEYAFSVPVNMVVERNLRKDMTLSLAALREIREEAGFHFAKDRAMRYLARRARSESEVRAHLKKYPQSAVDRIIDLLKSYDFLDDRDYARKYARDRLRFNPRSLRLISRELRTKGVHQGDIEPVIAELDAETDESEIAREIAAKKLRSYQHLDHDVQKRRLYQFLMRRGYSYDIIRPILQDLHLFEESQSW